MDWARRTAISLPQETARRIESSGSSFFINARINWNSDLNNDFDLDYTEWLPTPVVPSDAWKAREGTGTLSLYDYLCRYKLCVTVEEELRALFEEAINRPGSFYAERGAEYLVINPATLTFYKITGR